ncbi:hypothetical protein [Ornithinimicrobium kibberense]|uniref:hypothetical protein n=1 Tax=Ornithinimicrobium kibberense TaxID=282060 RepID=UPI00361273B7
MLRVARCRFVGRWIDLPGARDRAGVLRTTRGRMSDAPMDALWGTASRACGDCGGELADEVPWNE